MSVNVCRNLGQLEMERPFVTKSSCIVESTIYNLGGCPWIGPEEGLQCIHLPPLKPRCPHDQDPGNDFKSVQIEYQPAWLLTNPNPLHVRGSAAAAVGSDIFYFGGFRGIYSENVTYQNTVAHLNPSTRTVSLVNTLGSSPTPKSRVGMCSNVELKECYVFGGVGERPSQTESVQTPASYLEIMSGTYVNNAVHVLDTGDYASTGSCTWREMLYTGYAPDPRYNPAFTNRNNIAYVFGGACNSTLEFKNDLHRLNLESAEWSGALPVTGELPPERCHASLAPSSTSLLVLCGGLGYDGTNMNFRNDIFIFQTDLLCWYCVNTSHIQPPLESLYEHHSFKNPIGDVYIVGGCTLTHNTDQATPIVRVRTEPLSLQNLALQVYGGIATSEDVESLKYLFRWLVRQIRMEPCSSCSPPHAWM
ncbi:kelch domain-containing protein 1-like [Sycon ciliatum]|uniref:kelch domain-containing protein 1-like n=1 Tax=Sycon ciliatum TaxID=27933 RepID=UPI0031F64B4F